MSDLSLSSFIRQLLPNDKVRFPIFTSFPLNYLDLLSVSCLVKPIFSSEDVSYLDSNSTLPQTSIAPSETFDNFRSIKVNPLPLGYYRMFLITVKFVLQNPFYTILLEILSNLFRLKPPSLRQFFGSVTIL